MLAQADFGQGVPGLEPLRVQASNISPMPDIPHKYAIIVDGDNLDEAVEETAHLFYLLLGRALRARRRSNVEDREFEQFALEALALLVKYREVYTNVPSLELRDAPSEPQDLVG